MLVVDYQRISDYKQINRFTYLHEECIIPSMLIMAAMWLTLPHITMMQNYIITNLWLLTLPFLFFISGIEWCVFTVQTMHFMLTSSFSLSAR